MRLVEAAAAHTENGHRPACGRCSQLQRQYDTLLRALHSIIHAAGLTHGLGDVPLEPVTVHLPNQDEIITFQPRMQAIKRRKRRQKTLLLLATSSAALAAALLSQPAVRHEIERLARPVMVTEDATVLVRGFRANRA